LIGSCDFTFSLPSTGKLYGEYIWDSTLDESAAREYEAAGPGAKTGYLLGTSVPLGRRYELSLERTVIDDTVYTFPQDGKLAYRVNDSWLGHWSGPDSQTTTLELAADFDDGWQGAVRIAKVEEGRKLSPKQRSLLGNIKLAKTVRKTFKAVGCIQHSRGS
jgi:hypothetical protein